MNASLVAFYGAKPAALVELVESVQAQLRRLFGEEFSPYQVEQVHATLIGLEGDRNAAGELVNANYLSMRGEARAMDLASLLEHVKESHQMPFTVRIGGFERSRARIPSRVVGAHPFARTFSIQGTQAVVMGWPCCTGSYPTTLGRLRQELEAFGVLHKYHPSAGDLDDDLFKVVGRMRTQVDDAARRVAVDELRERLAGAPVEIAVDASNLMVVSYVDPALPLETSVASRLIDIDPKRLAALRDAR